MHNVFGRSTRRNARKIGFLVTSSMVMAASLVAGTAHAQEAAAATDAGKAAAADEPNVPSIIVTGIRGSLSNALNTKRNSQVIVDSISAQDIGALPDRTVSEALQRVPGITLQRTGDVNTLEGSDPGRVPAEGGGVFIRGLSWTRSEINGHDVFSANSGRGLSFEDVSPDLMGAVDVYKTPSADMVEGGIAGIVDLRTRKPLDSKNFVAVSGDWNYADKRKEGFFSGNAVVSHRWDTPGGTQIGLQLSASTGKTGNRTDAIQTGSISTTTLPAAQSGLPAGTTVALPSGLGYRSVEWTQVRHSYDAVLQVKPSSSLLFTFEGMIAKVTPRDAENAVQINDQNGGFSLDPSFTFTGPQHTLASGTLSNAQLVYDSRVGQQDKVTREFYGSMFWTPTDHLTVSVDVDHVNSHASVYSMTAFDGFGLNGGRPNVAFNLTGDRPSLTFSENGLSLSDPANYFWYAAMQHNENNRASSWAERADVTYTLDDGNFFKSFKVGLRNTAKDLVTQSTNYNWGLLSTAYWGGGTPIYLNQDPGNVGLPGQTTRLNFGNFMGGNVNVPGGWFPSVGLLDKGAANAYKYLVTTQSGNGGWSPLTDAAFNGSAGNNNAYGTNTQTEKTLAGYAMASFGEDSGLLGRFDGNIGVRVIRTRTTAVGAIFLPSLSSSSSNSQTAAACIATNGAAACQALVNAATFVGDGSKTPVDARNSYTDVLPTLNTRFYLNDKTILRFAVGKTIYRPSFTDLQANQTYAYTFQADGFTPAVVAPRTLTGGNPYLKPIRAWNFDASFEYYFGKANAVTLAAFFKDVSNYISPQASTVTLTRNGVTQDFQVNIPVNGGHGTIKGVEAGYTMFFDQLPGALSGLGFNGNYTFIASTGGRNPSNPQLAPGSLLPGNLPMQGLSKHSFNAALLYEKYGISARLAYNWRSEYLANANGANVNQPVWNEAYGQLDASFIVDVNSHLKVGLQAQNLLKAKTYIDVGPASLHPRYAWEETDRHIAFLVRSKF